MIKVKKFLNPAGSIELDRQPTWNLYLSYTKGVPYNYKKDEYGRIILPWFDEIFPNKKPSDVYENLSIMKEGHEGETYGQIFLGLTRAIQAYNEEIDRTRDTWNRKYIPGYAQRRLEEERDNLKLNLPYSPPSKIRVLPSTSGPEGIEHNDQRARYRLMAMYNNWRKTGSSYGIDNWHESPDILAQDARYIDLRRKAGLPFRHYYESADLLDGTPIKLYTELVDEPTMNVYGEIWYPVDSTQKKGVVSEMNTYFETGVDDILEKKNHWLIHLPILRKLHLSSDEPSQLNLSATIAHEFGHTVYPKTKVRGLRKDADYYFINGNGTEAFERIKLVLNYNNIRTVDEVLKLNGEALIDLYANYMEGKKIINGKKVSGFRPGMNNDIIYFWNTVEDWDKLAEWFKENQRRFFETDEIHFPAK